MRRIRPSSGRWQDLAQIIYQVLRRIASDYAVQEKAVYGARGDTHGRQERRSVGDEKAKHLAGESTNPALLAYRSHILIDRPIRLFSHVFVKPAAEADAVLPASDSPDLSWREDAGAYCIGHIR